jgi:hypothetical protein
LFFLDYALEDLVTIMESNSIKRNYMVFLLYSFVANTTNSHLRVLTKLKEKCSQVSKDQFLHILSRLLLYENEDISDSIYEFYLKAATGCLCYTSPVTRTKAVTILSYLSRLRLDPILPSIMVLQNQCAEEYWELKGQILILCSNALL